MMTRGEKNGADFAKIGSGRTEKEKIGLFGTIYRGDGAHVDHLLGR
jgi:hypothetical protein